MMNIAVTKELKCFDGYLVVPALCLHLVVGAHSIGLVRALLIPTPFEHGCFCTQSWKKQI